MSVTNLKNVTIKKLEDKNFNAYYLIVNNDNQDEAYFCFEGTVKSGWDNLVKNWESIHEIELEFEEKETNFKTYRKVISVGVPKEEELFV